jgi:hypothetical protein
MAARQLRESMEFTAKGMTTLGSMEFARQFAM